MVNHLGQSTRIVRYRLSIKKLPSWDIPLLFRTLFRKIVNGGYYHLHSIQVDFYMGAIYCVLEFSVQWTAKPRYIRKFSGGKLYLVVLFFSLEILLSKFSYKKQLGKFDFRKSNFSKKMYALCVSDRLVASAIFH